MKTQYEGKLKWLLFQSGSDKFPYRLFIEEKPGKFLSLLVQDKWPGPNKKIFCLSEGTIKESELPSGELVEKSEILSCLRDERKLSIILNRPVKKRCWFIFRKKEYKKKPGEFYEQIFWITQSSAVSERRGAYLYKSPKKGGFKVIIDINEKYPYKFPHARIERKKLPVGDYALVYDDELIAIAERKTKDNFIHEISFFDVLKLRLQELNLYPYKAVVFESSYSHFLTPKKFLPYSPSYLVQLLADLIIEFPQIQFIFCGSRKGANEWIYRWFERLHQNILRKRG